jgi:hypothetical protein
MGGDFRAMDFHKITLLLGIDCQSDLEKRKNRTAVQARVCEERKKNFGAADLKKDFCEIHGLRKCGIPKAISSNVRRMIKNGCFRDW